MSDRVAVRLTARQMLIRLTERHALEPFTPEDTEALVAAVGKGFETFETGDVDRFKAWAEEMLVKAALLGLVLDGKVVVRMTADDDEPEFVLREFAQVPRAPIEQRRVMDRPFQRAAAGLTYSGRPTSEAIVGSWGIDVEATGVSAE